jgi:hypothetical protein
MTDHGGEMEKKRRTFRTVEHTVTGHKKLKKYQV